jgi:hypothetical protein
MMRLLAAAILLCASSAAIAQVRAVPPEARRATMYHLQDRLVQLDSTQVLLSPGAQIRNADNRLILPIAIPPGSVVKFLPDAMGNVHRVWILTAQEAADTAPPKPLPQPAPAKQ